MPQKAKTSAEEKLRIIESYYTEKVGFTSAYREAGVGKATFRRWLSRYKTEGPAGFQPNEHNRKYTKETKISAVLDYLAGQHSNIRFHISRFTRWQRNTV